MRDVNCILLPLILEIMIGKDIGEIITELFNSLLRRYQKLLQTTKCSEFVSGFVDKMFYKLHKTNLNSDG